MKKRSGMLPLVQNEEQHLEELPLETPGSLSHPEAKFKAVNLFTSAPAELVFICSTVIKKGIHVSNIPALPAAQGAAWLLR